MLRSRDHLSHLAYAHCEWTIHGEPVIQNPYDFAFIHFKLFPRRKSLEFVDNVAYLNCSTHSERESYAISDLAPRWKWLAHSNAWTHLRGLPKAMTIMEKVVNEKISMKPRGLKSIYPIDHHDFLIYSPQSLMALKWIHHWMSVRFRLVEISKVAMPWRESMEASCILFCHENI